MVTSKSRTKQIYVEHENRPFYSINVNKTWMQFNGHVFKIKLK